MRSPFFHSNGTNPAIPTAPAPRPYPVAAAVSAALRADTWAALRHCHNATSSRASCSVPPGMLPPSQQNSIWDANNPPCLRPIFFVFSSQQRPEAAQITPCLP